MIPKINKRKLIEFIIILILGCIPLLWFRDHTIIMGHDSGLTLDPQGHFIDRLSAWTMRFGFGGDQSYAISGLFIHGLEALVSYIGFSIQSVQKIVFIFWFVLPGLAMFYLSSKIERKLKLNFFALPATMIYMINHFLLQGWFVAERTKFSVYAALPLILALFFGWQEKIISKDRMAFTTVKTGLLVTIILFFFNGEASIPLFGGLIVTFIVFVLLYFLEELSIKRILHLVFLLFSIVISSILVHAYWLIPYANFVKISFSQTVTFFGGEAGIMGWLKYVSQNSSLINLFRLQGIPEWYQNPLHPYAQVFLKNPIMITIGFLIPIIAFMPLLLFKKNRIALSYVHLFSFLALFSMIFIAGSHDPFGFFYILLVKYVPGFIAFRTPYYKFSPALWLSYSVLIGFTISYFLSKWTIKKRMLVNVLYGGILIAIVLYSFPFLTGNFFDYIKGVRSNRVVVPQYIYDYGKWSQADVRIGKRTLVLPPPNKDFKVDAYAWGYWSLAPLTSLLSNASIINESNFMSPTEAAMVNDLYALMRVNDFSWVKLARFLNINSIVLRKDFAWNLSETPTDNPAVYINALQDKNLFFLKSFGEWDVYDFKNVTYSRVEKKNSIAYLQGEGTDIGKIATIPTFRSDQALYTSSSLKKSKKNVLRMASSIYVKPTCVMCDLQWPFINADLYNQLLTRGSMFYSFIAHNEQEQLKLLDPSAQMKLSFFADNSLGKLNAIHKVIDEKKPLEIVLSTVDDYEKALLSLQNSLTSYFINQNEIDNNFLLTVSSRIHFEKNELIDRIQSIQPNYKGEVADHVLQKINKQYQSINKINGIVDSKLWRTQNDTQKRFQLIIPIDGNYELFYKPNNALPQENIQYILNGISFTKNPIITVSGWYDLGQQSFKKGNQNFEIEQPIRNEYKGSDAVEISTSKDGNCSESNLIYGEMNDIYRITFFHKRLAGNEDFYVGITTDGQEVIPLSFSNDLNISAFTKEYTQDYAVPNSKPFKFDICSYPQKNVEKIQSKVEIKDMVIQKINIPDLVLYLNVGKTNPDDTKSTITYKKDSQTQYTVGGIDTGPSIITLNDSYNPSWQLGDGSSENIIENGYANSWFITGKINTTIKYQRQKLVTIGFTITIATFFLIIGTLSILFFKQKKIHDKT